MPRRPPLRPKIQRPRPRRPKRFAVRNMTTNTVLTNRFATRKAAPNAADRLNAASSERVLESGRFSAPSRYEAIQQIG
jgi:hypothetical protein